MLDILYMRNNKISDRLKFMSLSKKVRFIYCVVCYNPSSYTVRVKVWTPIDFLGRQPMCYFCNGTRDTDNVNLLTFLVLG
jgi:hypothetical protein